MSLRFYQQGISCFIEDSSSTILVLAASKSDKDVFVSLGFRNVTFSNIVPLTASRSDSFSPFKHIHADAENLPFADSSFDYVVVHHSLHHCFSPHKSLLEMYRVSSKGLLFFESRETFISRIAVFLRLSYEYELPAVIDTDFQAGGVANTNIPNFVYRWTTREIIKTIACFDPYHTVSVKFLFYNPLVLPSLNWLSLRTYLLVILRSFIFIFMFLFPSQRTQMACFVRKGQGCNDLLPWISFSKESNSFSPVESVLLRTSNRIF